jgi:DNA topoisomerase-1
MIVEREREIQNFVPEEYWTIAVPNSPNGTTSRAFRARLHRYLRPRAGPEGRGPGAPAVVAELERSVYVVTSTSRKGSGGGGRRRLSPPARCNRRRPGAWASPPAGPWRIAQQLYEGLDPGRGAGSVGLITYMRTDSTNVAPQAQQEARQLHRPGLRGGLSPPAAPGLQDPDPHRRRRPTRPSGPRPCSGRRRPSSPIWTRDQYRLYQLIWQALHRQPDGPRHPTTR